MIVAVTGARSGLGSALIPKLQKELTIKKIIGIDIGEYQGKPEKIEFIKIDIREKEGIERALEDVDVVIHLAYIVFPKKIPKLKVIYDINVNGSKNVFQAAAKNKVKKIIHLSSQSVYGHVKECPRIVMEDAPRLGIKTTNFYYSHTKALVEKYLDGFEKKNPTISIIRIRPPIITGPHFILNLGPFSITNKKWIVFPVKRNRHQTLQLIHEDDLTDILMLAIKRDIHGAFNIGGRILIDLRGFLRKNYNVSIIPLPTFLLTFLIPLGRIWPKLQWLQALKYSSLLNTEKIEREFGWKAKYTTEQCIKDLNKNEI